MCFASRHKNFIVLLLLNAVSSLLPAASIVFTDGDFTYTASPKAYYDYANLMAYNGNGGNVVVPETVTYDSRTLYIRYINSVFKGKTNIESVSINAKLYDMQGIDNEAFKNCTNLRQIYLPEHITEIPGYCFQNCKNLVDVTLPTALRIIFNGAFYDCNKLPMVNLPDSVTYIYENAFRNCVSLRTIQIPFNTKKIYNNVFRGCTNLSTVVLHDDITTIYDRAFCECFSLINIELPTKLTYLGEGAFSGCRSLSSIVLPEGLIYLGGNVFNNCSSLQQITVPSTVTSYSDRDYHFAGCSNLTEAIIKSDCPLPWGMFSYCVSLESVEVPATISSINGHTFEYCASLRNIVFPETNPNYSIQNNFFLDGTGETLITSLQGTHIPDGVKSIQSYAFSGRELNEVIMPCSITNIGYRAFSGCRNLGNITIPESVTSIEEETFSNCSSLRYVKISESVTNIAALAFYGCSNLSSVKFTGKPPVAQDNSFPSKTDAIGYYTAANAESWRKVIDANGYWHELKMEEEKITYVVNYNTVGGDGVAESQYGEFGGDGILVNDGGNLHWEGHYFMGWALAPDGDVVYRPGDYIAEPTESDTVTLYAVWSRPALSLTPVDADWQVGSISFQCEDTDTSGAAHTYSLAYYNESEDVWILADGDSAQDVQLGSDGYVHLSDTKFASRNNGVGTVTYRVVDNTGRSAERDVRERHALYIALDRYQNGWQKDLSQPKIFSPSYLMNLFRSACEQYGRVGGYSPRPLANETATKRAIQSQLNYIATHVAVPGDTVVLYYCGHGTNNELTCYGQDEKLTKTDLFNALKVFPKGVGIVVVIDACHSTSMIEEEIKEDNRIAWITAALKDEYSVNDYFSVAFCEDGWFNGLADNAANIGDKNGYASFLELAKYAQCEMAKDYSSHKQICTFLNDDMLKNVIAGKSLTSSKTDRIFRWLTKHTSAFSSSEGSLEVAVATTAANGIHTIADCYELGIDPDNPDDDFRITHFEMVNGEPVFELNHTTDGSGESFLPRIKKLGKADLKDNWSEVPPGGDSAHRFFTVEVMKGE